MFFNESNWVDLHPCLNSLCCVYVFARFPNDAELRNKWIQALRRENFNPSRTAVICSKHFQDEDLDPSGFRVHIRPNAVPSIFAAFPPHLQKTVKRRRPPTLRTELPLKRERSECSAIRILIDVFQLFTVERLCKIHLATNAVSVEF